MLRHIGRKQFLFFAITTMCVVLGAAAYAKRKELFVGTSAGEPASAIASQIGQPVILTYVASGVPASLSAPSFSISHAINGNSVFISSLSVNVAASPGYQLNKVSLTLFEFDSQGMLRRADSWLKTMPALSVGASNSFTLPLNRRSLISHRLVLAVERASNATQRWQVGHVSLAQAAASIANGKSLAVASVTQGALVPDEVGSILCVNGLNRARQLVDSSANESKLKKGVGGFSCNQQERSFSVIFTGSIEL